MFFHFSRVYAVFFVFCHFIPLARPTIIVVSRSHEEPNTLIVGQPKVQRTVTFPSTLYDVKKMHKEVANWISYFNEPILFRSSEEWESFSPHGEKLWIALNKESRPSLATCKALAHLAHLFGCMSRHFKRKKAEVLWAKKELYYTEKMHENTPNKEVAYLYEKLGKMYSQCNKHKSSLLYFKKAVELKEKLFYSKDPEIARSKRHLGRAYYYLDQDKNALKYLREALAVYFEYSEKDFSREKLVIHGYIAEIHFQKGNYEGALNAYLAALRYRKPLCSQCLCCVDMIEAYNNVALMYEYLRSFDKAIKIREKALIMGKERWSKEDPMYVAQLIDQLGMTYYFKGDYDKAYKYVNEALIKRTIYLGIRSDMILVSSHINMAKIYNKQEDYDLALTSAQEARDLFFELFDRKEEWDLLLLAQINKLLGDTYDLLGEYKHALTCYLDEINLRYEEANGRDDEELAECLERTGRYCLSSSKKIDKKRNGMILLSEALDMYASLSLKEEDPKQPEYEEKYLKLANEIDPGI